MGKEILEVICKKEPLTSWLLLSKTHPGLWRPQTLDWHNQKPSWEWNELERNLEPPPRNYSMQIIFTVFLVNIKTKVQGQPMWCYLYHSMSNQSFRKTLRVNESVFNVFPLCEDQYLKTVFQCLFNVFPKSHFNILFSK